MCVCMYTSKTFVFCTVCVYMCMLTYDVQVCALVYASMRVCFCVHAAVYVHVACVFACVAWMCKYECAFVCLSISGFVLAQFRRVEGCVCVCFSSVCVYVCFQVCIFMSLAFSGNFYHTTCIVRTPSLLFKDETCRVPNDKAVYQYSQVCLNVSKTNAQICRKPERKQKGVSPTYLLLGIF